MTKDQKSATSGPSAKAVPKPASREERLAKALRANLRRRKVAAKPQDKKD